MNKTTAIIKLAVFGSILTLCVGFAAFVIILLVGDQHGAMAAVTAALIPLAVHTAASAFVYKRFRQKCGLSAPRFVILNALPALIIGVPVFLVSFAMCNFDIIHTDYDFKGMWGAYISLCGIGYSVVYSAVLSAVLGIKRAVGRRKERS